MNPTMQVNDYENRAQQRLRQIQEDYFPPPQKINCLFYSPPPHYTPTALYQPDYDDTFDPQTVFQVKKSTEVFIVLIPILIFGCFFVFVSWHNGSLDDGAYLMMAGGLVGILYSVVQICDRKAYLIIHQNGLYFYKNSLYIPWEHVIAAHLLEENDGEGTSYYFVIDYYDVYEDYFKVHRFAANGYDVSYPILAATIAHCLKKAVFPETDIQKITNLPIQTV